MNIATRVLVVGVAVGMTSCGTYAAASPDFVARTGHGLSKQAAGGKGSGWRDGGRISVRRDVLLMGGSTSHVVVGVATTNRTPQHPRYTSTISRRTPDGHWIRQRSHIGNPVAVDVNADGDAVIISTSRVDGGNVIATRWPRGADHVRSRVILKSTDQPAPLTSTRMSANGDGDVAVLVSPWEGTGERAVLLRKLSGHPWKPTLTIRPARYGGALDSVDITPAGAVVGAFTQDSTLSVRTMLPGTNTFGRPTLITTWPGIDGTAATLVDVKVGVNGDLATTWAYPETDYVSNIRLNILPVKGRSWQRDFQTTDQVAIVAVGRDGSVVIKKGISTRRWNPQGRSLTRAQTSFFKADNEQGDVLIGGGIYKGWLRLWPVGKPRGVEVKPPGGDQRAVVLTADHRVYLAILRDRTSAGGYHLRIRRF